MSLWGTGPFENDDAADWAADLIETPGVGKLEDALSEISHPAHVGYMEITECCNAVAAAEVFAGLLEKKTDSEMLPDETWSELARELLELRPPDVSRILNYAIAAVDRVLHDSEDSELLQAWQEDPAKLVRWTADVETLLSRLRTVSRPS
jgi:hypothetical protein